MHYETTKRTLARLATWHTLGLAEAVGLAYLFSHGSIMAALTLGLVYHAGRFIMHFAHDRAWNRYVKWGLTGTETPTMDVELQGTVDLAAEVAEDIEERLHLPGCAH